MKPRSENRTLALLTGLMLISLGYGCNQQPGGTDAGPGLEQSPSMAEVTSGPSAELVEGFEKEVAGLEAETPGPPGERSQTSSPKEVGPAAGGGIEFAFPHADREPLDHVALARKLLSSGDQAGAMLELEKAIYDDPADFSAAILLGTTARDSGRGELAVDAFLLATQIDPDADDPWLQLARISVAAGELDQAEQLVRRALRLNPKRALAHNVLGRIWLKRSHWERAVLRFEKALEISPTNVYYRNNLGFALLLKRDFQQAVEVLEPLAEQDGVKAFMLNNLGLAYEGAGRLQEASTRFSQALESSPGYVNARVNLDRMVQLAQRTAEPVDAVPGGGQDSEPQLEDDLPPGDELLLPEDGEV